ncbi:MAG: molecular chaperone TorD family protein [Acidobacteriota bacterium]
MEIFRTLGALIEPPGPALVPLAELLDLGPLPEEAEHSELFLFQLYPYASVYLGPEGMLGGEARDRIAGFWRALGQTPVKEPDHLTTLLAFYAELCEHGSTADPAHAERWQQARRAYLWEHLLAWLPVYLAKLGTQAPPFYRRWGRLLNEALQAEAEAVGPQDRLALHLRAAPPISDPRESDLESFLDSLLSPVRSGVLWTRDDLGRAARDLGIGSRIGERRFILEALLAQKTGAVLGWIAEEATAWAARLRQEGGSWGRVLPFWIERAETTAQLAAQLSQDDSPL